MSLVNDVLKDLAERKYSYAEATMRVPELADAAPVPVSQIKKQSTFGSKTRMALTLFLAGIAFSSLAVHRTAQTPYKIDPAAVILPKYIQPTRNADTSLNTTKAASVSPQNNELKIHVPKDTVNAPKQPVSKQEPRTSKSTTKAKPTTVEVKSVSLALTDSMPESVESEFIEVIHRPLSTEQQRLNDFHVAANLFKTGEYAEAEMRLKNILMQDDSQHQARMLLARLYAQQNLDGRAELVLSRGLLRYPEQASYVSLYAQMLAGQGRDIAAIDVLQQALPSAIDNADLHALLAGIYQRTGNSAQAAKSYLTALQIDPTRGEWWMGLGISSEQAGDEYTAESAYNEALLHPITRDIEQYVLQRLQQLSAKKAASKSQAKNRG